MQYICTFFLHLSLPTNLLPSLTRLRPSLFSPYHSPVFFTALPPPQIHSPCHNSFLARHLPSPSFFTDFTTSQIDTNPNPSSSRRLDLPRLTPVQCHPKLKPKTPPQINAHPQPQTRTPESKPKPTPEPGLISLPTTFSPNQGCIWVQSTIHRRLIARCRCPYSLKELKLKLKFFLRVCKN